MHQSLARYSAPVSLVHAPSWADFITTMVGFKVFGTHTGEKLALTWRQATFAPGQSTQLDVRFEAVGDQTRVTVEHPGWDEIPQDHVARHGFELMLFQGRLAEHWRALLASLDAK